MLRWISRLFIIKTRFEACAIIYALALGAAMRGAAYLIEYPGVGGWLLYGACMGAVVMAGAKLMEATRSHKGAPGSDRRRAADRRALPRG